MPRTHEEAHDMAFIQIIEARTKHADELSAIGDEFYRRRPRGSARCGARSWGVTATTPDRHFILAFFDSYESAMENSNLPETAALAEKQMALLDAPPSFIDLDVIEERT